MAALNESVSVQVCAEDRVHPGEVSSHPAASGHREFILSLSFTGFHKNKDEEVRIMLTTCSIWETSQGETSEVLMSVHTGSDHQHHFITDVGRYQTLQAEVAWVTHRCISVNSICYSVGRCLYCLPGS